MHSNNELSPKKSMFAFRLFLALTALVMMPVICMAQAAGDTTAPARGFNPGGSYALGDIETISTANGNMMMHIPLAGLPAGRAGLGAKLNLVYNSKLWDSQVAYDVDYSRTCNPGMDPFCNGNPDPGSIHITICDDEGYCVPNIEPGGGAGGGGTTWVQQNIVVGDNTGGWRYAFNYSLQVFERNMNPDPVTSIQCMQGNYYNIPSATLNMYRYKVQMTFPDGSVHTFIPYGYGGLEDGYFKVRPDGLEQNCSINNIWHTNDMTYYSTDGTYAKLVVAHDSDQLWWNNSWTLSLSDGTRVTYNEPLPGGGNAPQRIYDRNNNFIEFQQIANYAGTGHEATKIVDQLGRSIIVEYGGSSYVDLIHTTSFNNQPLTYQVNWGNIWVNKYYTAAFGQLTGYPNGAPYLVNLRQIVGVVNSIRIVERSDIAPYNFSYNGPTYTGWTPTPPVSTGWGEMSGLTLPSGASTAYQFQQDNSGSPSAFDVADNSPTSKALTYQLEYDGAGGPTTETTTYAFNRANSANVTADYCIIIAPDGGVTREDNGIGSGLSLKTTRPDGSTVERVWLQNNGAADNNGAGTYVSHVQNALPPMNPYVRRVVTSIANPALTPVLATVNDTTVDLNGNTTRQSEYDFMSLGSIPRDASINHRPTADFLSAAPVSQSVLTYNNPANSTISTNLYLNPASPQLRNAVATTEVQDGTGATVTHSEVTYDNPSTTGNVIQQKSWDSTKGAYTGTLSSSNSISVSHTYDGYGNQTTSTDARGIQSRVVYGTLMDPTGTPFLDGNGQQIQNLYPTETDSAFYDTIQQQTPSVQQRSARTYDFQTGLVLTATDLDNNITSKTTYDLFGRPVLSQAAYNTTSERRTSTEYGDVERRVVVRSDLATLGDGKLVSIQHYDQMGHVRLSRTLDSPLTQSPYLETDGIKTQTRYAYSGSNSYALSSTPYSAPYSYSATGETTMGWKRSKSDNVGRVIEVQTYSGVGLPAPWGTSTSSTGTVTTSYDTNTTTATDQSGKVRRSVVDGVGRLIRVDEPDLNGSLGTISSPAQGTSYTYDAAGGLTQINQGSQTRTFTYSSLGRLLSGINPEDGTISYAYDNNGNLTLKTDPRTLADHVTHITTSITYDEQNRAKVKTYNDGTPTVNYFYDNQSLPSGAPTSPTYNRGISYGRLVAVTYNGGSEGNYYGYDLVGSVLQRVQRTNSVNYVVDATYNKAGAPLTATYPTVPGASGRRTVNYTYNNDGQLGSLNSPATSYASGASVGSLVYTPHGALQSETYGNNLVHSIVYNSRLQPTEIRLGTASVPASALDLTYNYGTTTGNNGNITGTTISAGSQTFAQTFTYDSLNRLLTAQENDNGSSTAAWQQNFGYDRFGNRTQYIGGGSGTPGTPATSGSGTVTIGGSEQSTFQCDMWDPDTGACTDWITVYDSGTVSATVGSYTANVSFGSPSTATSIATALASNFNTNSSSPVTASVSGSTITLTAKITGSSTNYSLSTNVTFDSYDFGSASFTATRSGSTLTGGSDGTAGSPGGTPDVTFNGNNQIVGYVYDVMGNVLADGHHTYTYNAENLINGVDLATNSYTYDGEAHRVKKASGNLLMVYDIGGKLIAEFDSNTGALKKEYIYSVEGLLASVELSGGTKYTTEDHLGSPRIETDASGQVWSQHDYQPFGEEIANTVGARPQVLSYIGGVQNQPYANGNNDGLRQKFTGKERDTETGLDYSIARYYNSALGRFTGPDEFTGGPQELYDFGESASSNPTFYADILDPQSLNKYQYAYNNPLFYFDPDGHQARSRGIPIPDPFWVPPVELPPDVKRALGDAADQAQAKLDQAADSVTRTAKKAWKGFWDLMEGAGERMGDCAGAPDCINGREANNYFNRGRDPNNPAQNQGNQSSQNSNTSGKSGDQNDKKKEPMLGENGTQGPSKTMYQNPQSRERIDVENPNPGQRPGQIHYQDANNNKYLYDPKTKTFAGLSAKDTAKLLGRKEIVRGIAKALSFLGESQ